MDTDDDADVELVGHPKLEPMKLVEADCCGCGCCCWPDSCCCDVMIVGRAVGTLIELL